MAFQLTPELLEMGMARLGIAAAQFKSIDGETRKALIRLFMRALASGKANEYLKTRLDWIEARDEAIEGNGAEPNKPPTVRVSSRVVEGTFDRESKGRRGKP